MQLCQLEDLLISDTVTDASSRIGWILQILSRLSQADRPHSDLTSINTLDTLVKFLSRIANDDVSSSKAAKILNRSEMQIEFLEWTVYQEPNYDGMQLLILN